MHKIKPIFIIFIIVATIVTCVNPIYPHDQSWLNYHVGILSEQIQNTCVT